MANGKKKKSKKKIIIWVSVGIVFLLILRGPFCGKKETGITVKTEKAEIRDITQVVTATGKINPEYKVVITPEVTGEIVNLPVKEGDIVKKGQLLVRIKPDTYRAQRDRARANLDSARSNLKVAAAQLKFARAQYIRQEELYKKELTQKQEKDRAKSELDSRLAQYESQAAQVTQAEAALEEATESLNKTTIYSPMDGTISQLNVELGERVLGSGFSQGTNMMTVANLTRMEATVEVDENDVVLISIGDTARVELDAFRNKVFEGVVSQIGNSAQTRGQGTQEEVVNFEVKIALHDFESRVRPGMSCNADIETETKNGVLSVPIQSVTARSDKDEEDESETDSPQGRESEKGKKKRPDEVVFVAKDGEALLKKVKTGISDDNYFEIIEGIEAGDEVITSPYRAISRELKDKSKIVIKKEEKKEKEDKTEG